MSDKALIEEIREECRRRIKEKLAKPKNLADPLPRYDKVFFEGIKWLNSLARCPKED